VSNFVDVLKFTLQKLSALPVTQTLPVSAQLSIIKCTSFRGNCCPVVTLLHFAFQGVKYFILKLPTSCIPHDGQLGQNT
jgi:hypothetical protein